MPPKAQRRLTIAAGEECTLVGSSRVEVTLVSGVVEVAGAVLRPREVCVFYLDKDARRLILYSLEGGQVMLQNSSSAPLEILRGPACAEPVVRLCRRTLAPLSQSVVAVIGRGRSGKTLASHTICNALAEIAHENGTSDTQHVVLVDLNAESNSIYAPGCVSAATVEPRHTLWPGATASPRRLPVPFFVGDAVPPTKTTMPLFAHLVGQLMACVTELMSEFRSRHNSAHSSGVSAGSRIVVDVPAPDPSLHEGIYYRRVLEIIQPTHVLVVGESETGSWASFLAEDTQRTYPDCEFVFARGVASPCTESAHRASLEAYFAGTPDVPLGCAKVVVPLGQLQFYRVSAAGPEGASPVRHEKVRPTMELSGTVAALSHAEIEAEVAFAPIAGLLLVLEVDEANDEMILVVPTGVEALPRRFVLLPQSPYGVTARSETRVIEEAVVA